METKNYRFKCTIENENEEVILEGSTYIIPTSINEYGECESVDMEVGKIMRILKKQIDKSPLDYVKEELDNNDE